MTNITKKRLLIVGAGKCGKLILDEIIGNGLHYEPVGFIDDNLALQGKNVDSIPVLGQLSDIKKIVKEKDIDEILIAIPSLTGDPLERIIKKCKETQKITKIVPPIFDIIQSTEKTTNQPGKARVDLLPGKIRKVSYEDLIRRSPPEINVSAIKEIIENSKILITGAAGSIGNAITQEITKLKPGSLILIDKSEYGIHTIRQQLKKSQAENDNITIILGDVKNKEKMERIIKEKRPDIIIHTAAYKHVYILEDNPEEAIMNNILGTYNMIALADKYEVKQFVLVSTDKAVEPYGVMGYTKRICEIMIQNMPRNKTVFYAVRFGNVAGSSGSLFEIWEEQIKENRLAVTDVNMTRYFMLIQEAAMLILETLAFKKEGGIFIFDMGEQFKIIYLAKKFTEYYGYKLGKDIKLDLIGIREGEKLTEKLSFDNEKVDTTQNKRIFMINQTNKIRRENYFKSIEALKDVVDNGNKEEIIQAIQDLVK